MLVRSLPAEHRVVLVAHLLAWIEELGSLKLGKILAKCLFTLRLQMLQNAVLDVLVVRRFDL